MNAQGFTYDVFLSHSAQDKAIVRLLAQRLREDGLKVWFDEWAIPPGGNIPHLIDEGLEQSAVLVLCMSASSLGSDWATLESQAFRFADPVNRQLRFIPLRLDETEPRPSLRQFAYVDWRGGGSEEAYYRLLHACRRHAELDTSNATETRTLDSSAPQGVAGLYTSIALSADGRRAASGSSDGTVRVWNVEGKAAQRSLKIHRDAVTAVALSGNGMRVAAGTVDGSLIVWDLEDKSPPHKVKGQGFHIYAVGLSANGSRLVWTTSDGDAHYWNLDADTAPPGILLHGPFLSIALSPDGNYIAGSRIDADYVWDIRDLTTPPVAIRHVGFKNSVELSADGTRMICASGKTVEILDLEGDASPRVLEGHTGRVLAVALSVDGRRAISGSMDLTVRIWDLEGNAAPRILRGHNHHVAAVAFSADGERAVSASLDGVTRVWDLHLLEKQGAAEQQTRYTNAKVVLVGDSGSGKTGITVRLAHGLAPSRWPSTSGVWSTQWLLKDLPTEAGWDRELWLWDFGGQADQRLIHQLYLDHTAAVLLIFDGDKETVLPGLHEWQQALSRCIAPEVPVLLLAGRTDVGSRFDRSRVQAFARQNHYPFFETSAESNAGIPELRKALLEAIPWASLARHESPILFKRLKDEILRIRDEGLIALATFKELASLLTARLPAELEFSTDDLKAVISLLDGPGVVKELHFGSYILLRPEWINIYAQAVIRTLRAAEFGLGYMPVRSIREGKLIFQTTTHDGQISEEKRLAAEDEQIVLQSMESALLARRLCLQQDGDLIFPSYCGRERPQGPDARQYFVSYIIQGFLDDIYATLVVKLAHCGAFPLQDLWRDAADFQSFGGQKRVGIRLQRREEGGGEIRAHHVAGVKAEELVIFAGYIHRHLSEQSTIEVQRLRHYICPKCNESVQNRELAMERLHERGKRARILCQRCEQPIALWDDLEQRFADENLDQEMEKLAASETETFDRRSQGELLVHEVFARILSAGQKCISIPESQDEGIDLVVEFTDAKGRGTGRHMYLQLKAGNTHLRKRKTDGAEIFAIAKPRWVDYWTRQNGPMMLVIGEFADAEGLGMRQEKRAFANLRWMEIGEYLRQETAKTSKPVKQIVFQGDRLDAASVLRWRDNTLRS